MDLSIYPFVVVRKRPYSLLIPLIPLIFLLVISASGGGVENLTNTVDYYFGTNISASATDLAQYNQIGANGLIPIMRLGGVTKALDAAGLKTAAGSLLRGEITPPLITFIVILITIFLGYVSFAMVSRVVLALKSGKTCYGIRGINFGTVLLSFMAALVVVLISAFSIKGFELVLLLTFGAFFAFAIPIASAGEPVLESIYKAFDFMQKKIGSLITVYILSMGIAIAAQIGFLVVFMFPLSVLDKSLVPGLELGLSLVGVLFALFYQFVICARAVYDYNKKIEYKLPPFRAIAKKIEK